LAREPVQLVMDERRQSFERQLVTVAPSRQ
jgi:hypothetical protein